MQVCLRACLYVAGWSARARVSGSTSCFELYCSLFFFSELKMKLLFALPFIFLGQAHEPEPTLVKSVPDLVPVSEQSAWIPNHVPPECWIYASSPNHQMCNFQCKRASDVAWTDFDRLNLGLNLELLEFTLFDHGLRTFTNVDLKCIFAELYHCLAC
eukprot:Blabericola_migrator_1__2437@NODE_1686_length_4002_cov_81_866582_g1093_i0_p4_GENE_NODE_1686_length_4002_cov_81_866582_g1093_i0NODE_1686_length_4002_cov_81_866582_g1093_i0_p4_ORF_typecomplete_len157_score16_78Ferritin_2/PF13668_6/0_006_NODE_1686_length_4002_cov_81_866582_g1093_i020882558